MHTPRFHVHALALAVGTLVLLNVPMTKMLTPLIWALVAALAATSLIYAIAAFFEDGAHILTKLFAGLAGIIGLGAAATVFVLTSDAMQF